MGTSIIKDSDLFFVLRGFVGKRFVVQQDGDDLLVRCEDEADGNEATQFRVSNSPDTMSIVWSLYDIKYLRPDLTDDECMDVLRLAKDKHDASAGISWDTLKVTADDQYERPTRDKMFSLFVKNSFAKEIGSKGAGEFVQGEVVYGCKPIRDVDMVCTLTFEQMVDIKRMHQCWYGGDVVHVKIEIGGKTVSGTVSACGDIRAWLYDKSGRELCNIKDRSNLGGFIDTARYIADDEMLTRLLMADEGEENDLTLTLQDSNWWEFSINIDRDIRKDAYSELETLVLDGSLLTDAIEEAVRVMFNAIDGEVTDAVDEAAQKLINTLVKGGAENDEPK